MLQLEALTLGPLETNCYLAWDETSREDHPDGLAEAVVIDPADDGSYISDRLLQLQLNPKAILLTHGHVDHLVGALEVCLNFNTPLFCHPADTFLLKRAVSTAKYWFGQIILAPPPARDLVEKQLFSVGHEQLEILHTPGHTPGSICLLGDGLAFVGDLIFEGGATGRTDFSYANALELAESVEKLKKITEIKEVQPRLLPGHGNDFLL